MTPLVVILCYFGLLLSLGIWSKTRSRGTSKDYFIASHSIGPFLLLMSVFGTTMTAFALVGSTGESFERGIGVYGLMASVSGLVHAGVFYWIGMRLWAHGKRLGFVTQIQFFRERFESNRLGYLLFPILVALVIPYLLIGIIGAGKTVLPITAGALPDLFPNSATPQWAGGIPAWLTGLVVCMVVLGYVFAGGSRGAAWANAFQTLVFMMMGLIAFAFIVKNLGGMEYATSISAQIQDGKVVQTHRWDSESGGLTENIPPKVIGEVKQVPGNPPPTYPLLSRTVVEVEYQKKDPQTGELISFIREHGMSPLMFLTYLFIPLSVGMFPHVFQHWLTARNARAFRLTVVAHPLCIMIVWVPCVLIGVWATGILPPGMPSAAVLANMLSTLVSSPLLTGLLTAGVLAAIMSSLDSQFLCLGTMFTNDIVLHAMGARRFTDRQIILIARCFVIGIVIVTYLLSLIAPQNVFDLAIWCFSGFTGLVPLVVAALYWRRTTLAGAYSMILVTLAVWFYFFSESGYGGELAVLGGVMPVAIIMVASTATLIVVSLLTKAPSEHTIKKFFAN